MRYRRYYQKGGWYFFTVVAHERRTILIQPDIRAALREAIGKIRANYPFMIHAWVLLPDHLHAIWQLPEGDSNFSLRWNQIKRHVSFRCAYDKPIWQPRFWEHCLRDEADFQRHFDYVHWNPVKHGYVLRVADWPYSTFHRHVRAGIYAPDWGGDMSTLSLPYDD